MKPLILASLSVLPLWAKERPNVLIIIADGLDSEEHLNTFLGKNKKGRKGMVVEAVGRLAYRTKDYALLPAYKGAERNITGNEMGIVDTLSLFDLRSDKHQEKNVIAKNAKLAQRMQTALQQAIDKGK